MSKRLTYSREDLEGVLDAVAGDFAGSSLTEHVTQALQLLGRVVPFTTSVAYLVKKGGPTRPVCSTGIDAKGLADYPARFIATDPMRSTFGDPSAIAVTLAECARNARVDLRRNEFLNDFALPRYGIAHVLGSNALVEDGTTLTFSLHRPRALSDFGEREKEVLELAVPFLIRAFRVTHARDHALEILRRASGESARGATSGVAVLSSRLEVVSASPLAGRLLVELEESGGLADVLAAAQRLTGQLARDRSSSFADHHLLRKVEGALASIRLIAMRLSPGAEPTIQLVVDLVRSRAEPLVVRLAEPYRLTPREIEIAGLLHEGHAQTAIARRLGISAWTVRRHVMSIRDKLQVRTNEQILSRLLGVA